MMQNQEQIGSSNVATSSAAESPTRVIEEAAPGLNVEIVSELERLLVLMIPQKELTSSTSFEMEKIRRTLVVPGFRRGKAPLSLIGPERTQEAFEAALYSWIDAYFAEHIIKVLGKKFLGITNIQEMVAKNTALEYAFEVRFEYKPTLNGVVIPPAVVTEWVYDDSDELFDLYLQHTMLSRNLYSFSDIDGPVNSYDRLLIEQRLYTMDGQELEAYYSSSISLVLLALLCKTGDEEELGRKFLNLSVGDEFDYTLKKFLEYKEGVRAHFKVLRIERPEIRDIQEADVKALSFPGVLDDFMVFMRKKYEVSLDFLRQKNAIKNLIKVVLPQLSLPIPITYMSRCKQHYLDNISYTIKDRALEVKDITHRRPEVQLEQGLQASVKFLTLYQCLKDLEEFSGENLTTIQKEESNYIRQNSPYLSVWANMVASSLPSNEVLNSSDFDDWIAEKVCYLWLKDKVTIVKSNITRFQTLGQLVGYN